jgi:hypothetical protein
MPRSVILQGLFKVQNNIIAGVKVDISGSVYVTVPRWATGVPSTLNKLVPDPFSKNGMILSPYPSWDFNTDILRNCQSMTIDSHGRMWIIEVGRENFFDSGMNRVLVSL